MWPSMQKMATTKKAKKAKNCSNKKFAKAKFIVIIEFRLASDTSDILGVGGVGNTV